MPVNALTAIIPLLAYGRGWGWGWWWWWWIVVLFFVWLMFLPPFAWGPRWYGRGRALSPTPTTDYATQWRDIESEFLSAPVAAVIDADRFIGDLLATRSAPAHEGLRYREAHAIAERAERGEATNEELQGAMAAYRAIYDSMASGPQRT